MASAQVNGTYKAYIVAPSGARRLAMSANSYWWAPGGSSDGTIANTPEKWNYLNPSVDQGSDGYSILFTLTAGAAATVDASDGAFVLPVIVNGQAQTVGNSAHASGLGNENFTVDLAAADIAYVAGVETPFFQIRAKNGVDFRIGGGRVFCSIENNA